MHLGDLLREEISNYEDERRRLEVLFSEQVFSESIYPYTRYTVQSYIADDFMNSHFRGTSISVEDFLGQCEREWRTPSLKGLLFYCEVLLNLLTLIDMRHGSLRQAMALKNLIVEAIAKPRPSRVGSAPRADRGGRGATALPSFAIASKTILRLSRKSMRT